VNGSMLSVERSTGTTGTHKVYRDMESGLTCIALA
jgi:hypothetical protein